MVTRNRKRFFLEVQEAYKVLKDTDSREAYDARLDDVRQDASYSNDNTNKSRQQSKVNKQDFNMHDIEKNFEHFFWL